MGAFTFGVSSFGGTDEFGGTSLIVVTKDSILKWGVAGVVTKDSIMKWNVGGVVIKDSILKWNLSGVVFKDSILKWRIDPTWDTVPDDAQLWTLVNSTAASWSE